MSGRRRRRPPHRKAPLPHKDAQRGCCRFCGESVSKGHTGRERNWHDGREGEENCVLLWKACCDSRVARKILIKRDGRACCRCERSPDDIIDGLFIGGKLEVDHIVPLADGGGFGLDNLQLLCNICHKEKTAKENSARSQR